MSLAPSASPVMAMGMGAPSAGDVNWPLASKVRVPEAPEIAEGVPAVPPLTSSPGMLTAYAHGLAVVRPRRARRGSAGGRGAARRQARGRGDRGRLLRRLRGGAQRSEEHTSELQSLRH